MPQISLDWDTFKGAYPMRPLKDGLKSFMDSLGPGNTPCCVQISHALGVAGCYIGKQSNRRSTSSITTSAPYDPGTRNYLLAVDEINWFLTQNFGVGDEISTDDDGNSRTIQDMKDVLNGRTGILVFSDLGYGKHTEIWDVDHMHQRDMSPTLFHQPKVFFWDVMITEVA